VRGNSEIQFGHVCGQKVRGNSEIQFGIARFQALAVLLERLECGRN
jgi:hypothetical protein